MGTNEEINSLNGSDSFDNSVSTAMISRDSNGSNYSKDLNNIINFFKGDNNGFLGVKNKPDLKKIYKNDDQDDLLTLQITYALSKMSAQYSVNNNPFNKSQGFSSYFDYYFGNNNNNTNTNTNTIEQQNNYNNNRFNTYYNKFSFNPQNQKSKNFTFKSEAFN